MPLPLPTASQGVAAAQGNQVHLFVDLPNTVSGARAFAAGRPQHPWGRSFCQLTGNHRFMPGGPVDANKLTALVESSRPKGTRVLAGTYTSDVVPGTFHFWESAQYRVYHQRRDARTNSNFVVHKLVTEMHRFNLTVPDAQKSQHTVVLLTGDGATQVQDAITFPVMVEFLLKQQFFVEVWSWSGTRSKRFDALVNAFPGRMAVLDLDAYRSQICLP